MRSIFGLVLCFCSLPLLTGCPEFIGDKKLIQISFAGPVMGIDKPGNSYFVVDVPATIGIEKYSGTAQRSSEAKQFTGKALPNTQLAVAPTDAASVEADAGGMYQLTPKRPTEFRLQAMRDGAEYDGLRVMATACTNRSWAMVQIVGPGCNQHNLGLSPTSTQFTVVAGCTIDLDVVPIAAGGLRGIGQLSLSVEPDVKSAIEVVSIAKSHIKLQSLAPGMVKVAVTDPVCMAGAPSTLLLEITKPATPTPTPNP